MNFKHLIALAIIVASAMLGVAAESARLDKEQALQVAMDYAREQKWDVKSSWGDVAFNEKNRE